MQTAQKFVMPTAALALAMRWAGNVLAAIILAVVLMAYTVGASSLALGHLLPTKALVVVSTVQDFAGYESRILRAV
jgi:hypothetical protein